MAYRALSQKDAQEETVTLLGRRSSMSSTEFPQVKDTEGHNKVQERQLATPANLHNVQYALEWMLDFEEIACANNWSPQAKFDIVPVFLSNVSLKAWFRESRHEWGDFDTFKRAFNERYRKDASGKLTNAVARKELNEVIVIFGSYFLILGIVIWGIIKYNQ